MFVEFDDTDLRIPIVLICAALAGCSAEGPPADPFLRENEGRVTSELMTGDPNHVILGHVGVVWIKKFVPPDRVKRCTGWILNERVVVTAAHCLVGFEGPSATNFEIEYISERGRLPILAHGDPVQVDASSSFEGDETGVDDFFSNPLNPSENSAKHDIGFMKTAAPIWPNTTYEDYLRVYTDTLSTLTSVYVYGMGNRFRTVKSLDDGFLRYGHFNVESPAFGSDLVISTTANQSERLCSGDSGGPYIKKINGMNLVAGVHHGTDREEDEFCPVPGGDQWGEKLTWSGPDDFDWLLTASGSSCQYLTPSGNGNDYARCYALPFINSAPDNEQTNGDKMTVVAQVAGGVL